ncbi:MAG: Endonuclease [Candidatus Collierbacteria bacterium GW2011_GWC2_44_18]|uniref:Endonuclease n=1 Tax=Candidatus Collierbacteria bacterium GW2011_GWC2_44_18 TaxID=1618392 RepID=A0A0G1HR49_9BACT|nr:MAG: Endonuclease [Candidatus Collierbacteria bacterium GW2011_GWC2_44_18]
MANFRNGTLYVGVTNNLLRRVWEHKNDLTEGFTNTYSVHTLVYYEFFDSMIQAIEKEKQIKSGSRKSKLKLIENMNPEWVDLYESLI